MLWCCSVWWNKEWIMCWQIYYLDCPSQIPDPWRMVDFKRWFIPWYFSPVLVEITWQFRLQVLNKCCRLFIYVDYFQDLSRKLVCWQLLHITVWWSCFPVLPEVQDEDALFLSFRLAYIVSKQKFTIKPNIFCQFIYSSDLKAVQLVIHSAAFTVPSHSCWIIWEDARVG